MNLLRILDRLLGWVAFLLVRVYQLILSPLKSTLFGSVAGCRFHPTCSHYASLCFRQHTFFQALFLTIRRLGRCHPFNDGGYDPVPPVMPKTPAKF